MVRGPTPPKRMGRNVDSEAAPRAATPVVNHGPHDFRHRSPYVVSNQASMTTIISSNVIKDEHVSELHGVPDLTGVYVIRPAGRSEADVQEDALALDGLRGACQGTEPGERSSCSLLT